MSCRCGNRLRWTLEHLLKWEKLGKTWYKPDGTDRIDDAAIEDYHARIAAHLAKQTAKGVVERVRNLLGLTPPIRED